MPKMLGHFSTKICYFWLKWNIEFIHATVNSIKTLKSGHKESMKTIMGLYKKEKVKISYVWKKVYMADFNL